jgi:hypothetical protein
MKVSISNYNEESFKVFNLLDILKVSKFLTTEDRARILYIWNHSPRKVLYTSGNTLSCNISKTLYYLGGSENELVIIKINGNEHDL